MFDDIFDDVDDLLSDVDDMVDGIQDKTVGDIDFPGLITSEDVDFPGASMPVFRRVHDPVVVPNPENTPRDMHARCDAFQRQYREREEAHQKRMRDARADLEARRQRWLSRTSSGPSLWSRWKARFFTKRESKPAVSRWQRFKNWVEGK